MKVSLFGFAVAFAIVGCHHDDGMHSSETTTTAGSYPVTNEAAIENITAARCDRELSCNNIGAGKDYDSFAACTRELHHNARASFNAQECPHGIDDRNLTNCLSDIRNERCGNPLDTLERVTSCRKGKLCR
ncbi:DUF6184 family natural product biosynthesis lipoprotein [Pendulispora brunnea]|uniref:DUF6184 family natural product biosynthesis lipoprotein n=1 Tax=Pendulispora brunnea TaxID=2905690 RepID=A0ABZ2K4C0_9BACT